MKLLLFDIDNTLFKTSKIHGEAFLHAFSQVYGVETSLDVINPHGLTDKQIIVEVLRKNSVDEEEIFEKLEECCKVMEDYYVENSYVSDIEVLDGVRAALHDFEILGYIIGSVTGNLERIARKKFELAGIDSVIRLGGFGSDDMKRENLVRIAIDKAKARFDFVEEENVYLFGDTPLDALAAKRAGVTPIIVVTGIYSREDILEKFPDVFVLDNLSQKEKLFDMLESEVIENKN